MKADSSEKRWRVLVGMPSADSWGGPALSEPPFVEGLRALGVDAVEEVYVYGDKKRKTKVRERVARVLEAARRLRRRMKAERFDVVHLNTACDKRAVLRDNVTVSFIGNSRAKIFLKLHGSDARFLQTKNPAWRFLSRRLWSRVDGFGVLSAEEKLNLARAGVDERKIFQVKYAIESDKFKRDKEGFAARLGVAEDLPVLLFSARFITSKGLFETLRACAMVRERGHKFLLCCLGDGEIREQAERETRRLKLDDCVRFFGYIPEAETDIFHANATMLVFPTYHDEGFPLVILKSIAAGLPIITTQIRGAADYLREPENCLWTEPKNPEMLAEKIITLLTDADLRETMRRCNLELAQKFTARAVAQEFIEIIKSLESGVESLESSERRQESGDTSQEAKELQDTEYSNQQSAIGNRQSSRLSTPDSRL